VAVPIAIGAAVAAVAVIGLVRDRLWGLVVGLIWATLEAAFAAYMVVLTLFMLAESREPSGVAQAARSVPLVFGIATAASIAVLVILIRDRPASVPRSPRHEASPPVPIDGDHARPRQMRPSTPRSPHRRSHPPLS